MLLRIIFKVISITLKYAEFAFVYYIHKLSNYQAQVAKTVKINYIRNVSKIGLSPQIKVNVHYAKWISFNKKLLLFYNGRLVTI